MKDAEHRDEHMNLGVGRKQISGVHNYILQCD